MINTKVLGFFGMLLGFLAAFWPWFFLGELMKTLEIITGAFIFLMGIFMFMPRATKFGE
ncbi:MAG: hypothetical protein ACE5JS_20825 [Nitrospinota bacterium]